MTGSFRSGARGSTKAGRKYRAKGGGRPFQEEPLVISAGFGDGSGLARSA
jgi:hypothetical protein